MPETTATLPTRSTFSELLCGPICSEKGEMDEILDHLAITLDYVLNEFSNLQTYTPAQVSLYGPFLGRSILEIGCTAIITRLDPFRVLLVRERQMQPDFELDRPHKSSIRWQGDVLAEKVPNLWDDKYLQNPTRALLGDYYTNVIWMRHMDVLFDKVDVGKGGAWLDKLRKDDSATLCPRIRGDISKLYSTLSKGIHHEMVIPLVASFDKATVSVHIKDVLYNVASLGLISHTIRHAYGCVTLDRAIHLYERSQELEAL